MLLDTVFKESEAIIRQSRRIRMILLFLALYFLKITRSKNNVYTEEALHKKMNEIDRTCLYEHVAFTRSGDVEKFVLNSISPNMTILIHGKKSDRMHFANLISSMKNARVVTKNIKVVLTESGAFESDCLQYFCKINLVFGDKCYTKFFPLKSQQPNSDLLFISKEYFPVEVSYRICFKDHFLNNLNRLEISISHSEEDASRFLLFTRALQNLHSHSLGSYFYIPLKEANISVVCMVPFIVTNVVYSAFSSVCLGKFGFSKGLMLVLLYLCSPLFIVLFLHGSHLTNALCMILFTFIDFRYGFLYTLLIFVKNAILQVFLGE